MKPKPWSKIGWIPPSVWWARSECNTLGVEVRFFSGARLLVTFCWPPECVWVPAKEPRQ